ncbi:RNA polymerase sigma factor [Leifsonia sp. P73]|uniref:RNA polymerase sigma factor n=1 Tax=Leifsonia sp. P73 TaxID=3423959 RepID=UPI003DA4DBEF
MDTESSSWLTALSARGAECNSAQVRLHELLLKVGMKEAYRRGPAAGITGPELDDMAHQAANDAMIALLSKLDTFRGESRFTTWAYRFVVLEVSHKLGRHYWRRPTIALDSDDWDRLPAKYGADPLVAAQQQDLIRAIQRAVETLTEHQRNLFVSIVVNGVSIDAMAARSGSTPGALYKTVFDARRKIRAHLTANGYLERDAGQARAEREQVGVETA